ncbi:T9SS type A sorting domain-containing protein [Hymenobacter terrenus]|uniref:T9SS type A sorting domain-containing protein n=1 Tax=Hymenobacter terrenus TaxID=1629124 RepID=UPI000619A4AC|nr:T9SS type A sorting domain-containing protein [Hymenobacter terrenus]
MRSTLSQSLFSSGHQRVFATLLAMPLVLLAEPAAHAQAPAWQTAATVATGALGSSVKATATDAAGNVYVAGRFVGSATFGSTVLTSASAGDFDAFVAKWSPATNSFVWAQRVGGAGRDEATAVAVSGTNVYLAGNLPGSTSSGNAIDFGGAPLAAAGTGDVFVARLTDAGAFTWALRSTGSSQTTINALAVSGASLYVAGEFFATTFGSIPLTSAGGTDVFVAKLTDTGAGASYAWAQRAGGILGDQATSLAVSGTSVFLGGYFRLPATFGGSALTSAQGGFVAKLIDAGASGAFDWAQSSGDLVSALAVNGAAVYAAGAFSAGTAVFGTTTLSTGGGFLAKLADAGASASYTWALSNDTRSQAVAVRGTSVYVAGYFNGAATAFGSVPLTNSGRSDLFVAKVTDAGASASFAWAQRAGGTNDDQATALAVTNTNVFVAGDFQGPSAVFSGTSLTTAAAVNGFVASLPDASSPLATSTARQAAAPITLAPNPAHAETTLHLRAATETRVLVLLDATGRQVRFQALPAGTAAAPLNVAGLAPGLYHIRCGAASQRLVVK